MRYTPLTCASDQYTFIQIGYNKPISQIPQCIRQISHNATFCNRNVHTCAHFCYKKVHWGICHRCILGFVRWFYWTQLTQVFRLEVEKDYQTDCTCLEPGWYQFKVIPVIPSMHNYTYSNVPKLNSLSATPTHLQVSKLVIIVFANYFRLNVQGYCQPAIDCTKLDMFFSFSYNINKSK